MKNIDNHGKPIYDYTFNRMKDNAEKLYTLGFNEHGKKSNLFYWKNEEISIYADMRSYKDRWGDYIPIWGKVRRGAPQFYHFIFSDKLLVARVNRTLWNMYHQIKEKKIPYIDIGPFGEVATSWSQESVPNSSFFLRHSEIPLIVDDELEPNFYYGGVCWNCGGFIEGKKLFCNKCEETIDNIFMRRVIKLMKKHVFNYNPSVNKLIHPMIDLKKSINEAYSQVKLERKIRKVKSSGCRLCGKRTHSLIKHHITYTPENILKICPSCHGIIHHCSFPNFYWRQKIKRPPKKKKHTPQAKKCDTRAIKKKQVLSDLIKKTRKKEDKLLILLAGMINEEVGEKRKHLYKKYNDTRMKRIELMRNLSE